MMSRRKWLSLAYIVAALIVLGVVSGGLVVSKSEDFNGQSSIHLADGLDSDVWLAPRLTNWSIPFVFHYRGASGPYALRLQIWDPSKTYSSIAVTAITLEYGDGELFRVTDTWSRQLRAYTQYNSSSAGIIATDMMMLSDIVPDLVNRHTDVTITIKGHLGKSDGHDVEFSASETFEAESGFGISTFWRVLANS